MDDADRTDVEINGARIWVEESGEGPALVLVHAGIADSRMWDPQWSALSSRYRLVRYDLRGFGRSSLPPGEYAHHEDLRALLDALQVPHAVLVGASMGGEVALAFAVEHPARVDALVLLDTLAGLESPSEHLRDGWRQMEEALDVGDLDRAVEIELGMWVDGPRRSAMAVDPKVRALVREMDLGVLRRVAEHEHASEAEPSLPVRERLGEVRCPTLVICGALDVDDARTSAEALVSMIPRVRQVVVPGVGHLPSLEAPDKVNAVLLQFLAESLAPDAGAPHAGGSVG